MIEVGIIGWRGMVGSVLLERMRAERDFELIEPVFFSTSQAGGKPPDIGRACVRGAGRQRSRGIGPPAHADQHSGRRVHPGGARAAARGGLAGVLDRRCVGAANGAIGGHRSRPRESARDAGGARAGHQGLHRRQLHGVAHAHGGMRAAARGRGGVDYSDDLSIRIGSGRSEHARAARADGRAVSMRGAAAARSGRGYSRRSIARSPARLGGTISPRRTSARRWRRV